MDKSDYEKACNTHLANKTFYEEVPSNPTSTYKAKIAETADQMYKDGFIDDFENNMLKSGDQTPSFYALPKVHKQYVDFPSIRPICSGSDSPTTNSSEFVDTFIKPIAQKQPSYIRDTTDFIHKTKDIATSDSDILVTMDVTSLYTNIDQKEGSNTCEEFLNQRLHPSIPTKFIITLINLILKCNTMFFNGHFFHQIKGTAMGTAMAVSFANLFMSRLEQDMLNDYEDQYNIRPKVWLRFIDDIFFIWSMEKKNLSIFLISATTTPSLNQWHHQLSIHQPTT